MKKTDPALTVPSPPQGFAERWNVSRESLEKLQIYTAELVRWQSVHNLIARSELPNFLERHIADALQLVPLLANCQSNLIDLGSGGGIPAIPLAIVLQTQRASPLITMVESNSKKCAFLRVASRQCEIDTRIINKRIESLVDSDVERNPDVVIARGLAPLKDLLALGAKFPSRPQRMLFMKGQHVDVELTAATKCWNILFSKHPSETSLDGCILEIHEAERVNTDSRIG